MEGTISRVLRLNKNGKGHLSIFLVFKGIHKISSMTAARRWAGGTSSMKQGSVCILTFAFRRYLALSVRIFLLVDIESAIRFLSNFAEIF
jgi:hypothetical protein